MEDSRILECWNKRVWDSMSETLDMHRLKAEHMLKRARLAALGESFVILTLLVWLSLEYQNNFYMQEWLAAHFWPPQWLLNGTLVGMPANFMPDLLAPPLNAKTPIIP